jgi:hypothetical protein
MRRWLFLGCLFSVVACGTLNRETTNDAEITYEKKTFLLESSTGCKNDRPCAKYEVTYPVFSGVEKTVEEKLQREIELTVSMGDPEAEDKSMQKVAEEFIDNYTEFIKEFPEGEGAVGWYYKADVVVNVLTDTLLSLEVSEEYFTGGAHGGSGTFFININPKTGERTNLSTLLKPGFEHDLTKSAEATFRKTRELPDTASYRFNGFEFPQNRFELSKNYGFTKEGIVFVFNSYEIAPYAAGSTEFVVPYSQIRAWLK